MFAIKDDVEVFSLKIAGLAPPSVSPAVLLEDKTVSFRDALSFRGIIGAESALGNPTTDGYLLSSTAAGARSWVAPYSLPAASTTVMGGVKVGAGLSIASGVLSVSYGTVAGTACQGNDSRLSDARTPTAHVLDGASHIISGKTAGQMLLATAATTFGFVSMSGDATLSGTGVLALAASGVTAGAYGGASVVPVPTVDAKGRVTAMSTATITPAAIGAAASGHNHDSVYLGISATAASATKLATARTLTIGGTSKTFDGSANVSWTLAEIGAQAAGSYAAASHSHAIADVTSLQTELDSKLESVTADATSRAANTVYAAPNGAAGTAVFRSLVAADIPSLDTSKLTSGTLGYARGGTGISAPGSTAGNLRWSGSAYMIDTASYALASAIPSASSTTPAALGTAAVGTGTTWARADHVHTMPTAAQVGAAASGHNHTLDSLSNVTITSNVSGEILKWSGTAWVNNTLAEAGIQSSLGYTPVNKAGDTGIGNLVGLNGAQTRWSKDITPTTAGNNNYSNAPIVVQRVATSGTTAAAGIGFHNNGVNAAFFYYDPELSQFRYNKHVASALVTLYDTSNLTNLNQLTNGPGYLTGNQTIKLSGDVSGSGSTSISVTNNRINVTEHSSNNANYPVVWDNTSRQLFHTASKLLFNPATGTLTSTAFSGPLSGNASTATQWQTASTLTIGSTGKSVNGTANVSWSLAEIGAPASASVNLGTTFEGSGDPFTNRSGYGGNGGVRSAYGVGPFANYNVWYNMVDVRHRNALNSGDIYGGELVWGMSGFENRLAFRSRGADGTPTAWTEVWTNVNLPSPASLTASNTWTGTNTFRAISATYIDNIYALTTTKAIAGGSYYGIGMTMSTRYNSNSPEIGLRSAFSGSSNSIGITNTSASCGFIINQADSFSAPDVSALGLTSVTHLPSTVTSSGEIPARSLVIVDASSDIMLTLPPPGYAGGSIKIAVASSGSSGHTVVPSSGSISWSGMRSNGDYLDFQAHPTGTPSGYALRLKPGLYEFIAVSSTRWLCSSSPRIP